MVAFLRLVLPNRPFVTGGAVFSKQIFKLSQHMNVLRILRFFFLRPLRGLFSF